MSERCSRSRYLQRSWKGLIFDNLSDKGLTEAEWIEDFHCLSDRFTIAELGD